MRGYLVRRHDRYYAVVYEGIDPLTRKERRTWRPAGTNRRDAERVLGELVQARARRGPVFTRRITVGAFLIDVWLPARKSSLRPTTYGRYEREIRRHIVPTVGSIPLQRVRADTLDALYTSLLQRGRQDGEGLAPKTVLNLHLIISSALGDAVRRDLVTRNEAKLAHPPKLRAHSRNAGGMT